MYSSPIDQVITVAVYENDHKKSVLVVARLKKEATDDRNKSYAGNWSADTNACV